MFQSTNLTKSMREKKGSENNYEHEDENQSLANPSGFYDNFVEARGDMIFGLSSEIAKYRSIWAKLTRRADYLASMLNDRLIAMIQSEFIKIPDGDELFNNYKRINEAEKKNSELTDQDEKFADNYRFIVGVIFDEIYDSIKHEQKSGIFRSSKNLSVATMYTDYLKEHKHYSFKETFLSYGDCHYSQNEKTVRTILSKYMSRASKAGLQMLIDSPGTEHVHFILDNINLDDVVLKSVCQDTDLPSITGSELRYLYRKSERSTLNKKVHFYLNGKETQAPWHSNPELWKIYCVSNRQR